MKTSSKSEIRRVQENIPAEHFPPSIEVQMHPIIQSKKCHIFQKFFPNCKIETAAQTNHGCKSGS